MEIFPSHVSINLSTVLPDSQPKGFVQRLRQFFKKRQTGKENITENVYTWVKPFRLKVAQRTDVGRKRRHNEDRVSYIVPQDEQVLDKKGALFVIADGMGGHAAGEVASELAVDTVCDIYYQDEEQDIESSLKHAIKEANTVIYQQAAENVACNGMGTTCVAVVLHKLVASIANVGDSRAYIVHDGQVRQISQDHSWVAEQERAGLITAEQARQHAMRNIITRSLGHQTEVDIDLFTEELVEGDALVLCSDGLSGMLSDDEILHIVEQFSPQESVYRLIEQANKQGGTDNITTIVVRVTDEG